MDHGSRDPGGRTASFGLAGRPSVARPFALVLSGGGARGYSHAGVLRVLLRWGYRPSAIGSSGFCDKARIRSRNREATVDAMSHRRPLFGGRGGPLCSPMTSFAPGARAFGPWTKEGDSSVPSWVT